MPALGAEKRCSGIRTAPSPPAPADLLLILQQQPAALTGKTRHRGRESRSKAAKTPATNTNRMSLEAPRIGHACCKEAIGKPFPDRFKT
ncbi:MAG TPA: hypothetical protein VIN58_03860 [Roseateles sp.]